MSSVWTKADRIKMWVNKQTEPFTINGLRQKIALDVSLSTIYKVLDTMPIKYVNRHHSGANFRRMYFPIGTTDETIREWLNAQTKAGKSKAKIFGYQDKPE